MPSPTFRSSMCPSKLHTPTCHCSLTHGAEQWAEDSVFHQGGSQDHRRLSPAFFMQMEFQTHPLFLPFLLALVLSLGVSLWAEEQGALSSHNHHHMGTCISQKHSPAQPSSVADPTEDTNRLFHTGLPFQNNGLLPPTRKVIPQCLGNGLSPDNGLSLISLFWNEW